MAVESAMNAAAALAGGGIPLSAYQRCTELLLLLLAAGWLLLLLVLVPVTAVPSRVVVLVCWSTAQPIPPL